MPNPAWSANCASASEGSTNEEPPPPSPSNQFFPTAPATHVDVPASGAGSPSFGATSSAICSSMPSLFLDRMMQTTNGGEEPSSSRILEAAAS